MARDVDDEQASMIERAILEQRRGIADALERLADDLGFDADAARFGFGRARPDVLRARRDEERTFLFVGLARGLGEPVEDPRHTLPVLRWMRRFARLLGAARIAGGYVIVGTQHAATARSWTTFLGAAARRCRVRRDGATARFCVRPLAGYWMAC